MGLQTGDGIARPHPQRLSRGPANAPEYCALGALQYSRRPGGRADGQRESSPGSLAVTVVLWPCVLFRTPKPRLSATGIRTVGPLLHKKLSNCELLVFAT